MNYNNNELLRELSSLPPEDQGSQFSDLGLSGIRRDYGLSGMGAYDGDDEDITHELNRMMNFNDTYQSDDREFQYEYYSPEYTKPMDVHVQRNIIFDDHYEQEPTNDISEIRKQYGGVPIGKSSDVFDRTDETNSLVFNNATFDDTNFDDIIDSDPREGTSSILYDNNQNGEGYGDDESLSASRVFVTNFLEDLTLPLGHVLVGLQNDMMVYGDKHHSETTSMLSSLLRATLEGNSSTESSFLNGLKFQYELFMRHPLWNTLVGIQRYLISPAFKALGGLLFGFNKKSSVEEKILKAIEKQTEFQMTGEIGGRGFFQKIIERGVLGSAASAIAFPFMNRFGLSTEDAQRREDARSRGETVDGGIGNWLNDKFRSSDITKRGRNGLGTEGEEGYQSDLERIGKTDVKDIPSIIANLFKKKYDESGFDELTSDVELESLWESIRQNIRDNQFSITDKSQERDELLDDLNNMSINTVASMVIRSANVVFESAQSNDDSGTNISGKQTRSSLSDGDVNDLSNQLNQFFKENNTTTSKVNENVRSQNSPTFTNKYDDPMVISGKDPSTSIVDLSFISNISSDEGLLIKNPITETLTKKDAEFTSLTARKQENVWDEEQTHRDHSDGLLSDIRKYNKKTAKETEKTRKQGIWRMLFGLGGMLIAGVGAVVSGVIGIGTAIAAGVGTIVTALWATKGKNVFDALKRGGSTYRNRRTSRPPRTQTPPTPRSSRVTAPPRVTSGASTRPSVGSSVASGANATGTTARAVKGVGRVGGVVGLGLAGMQAHDIWTDEEATTNEKLEQSTGLGGSLAGGWAGMKAGAAVGGVAGAGFLGIGALPGAIIGGLAGGFGGSILGGMAGDSVGAALFGEDDEVVGLETQPSNTTPKVDAIKKPVIISPPTNDTIKKSEVSSIVGSVKGPSDELKYKPSINNIAEIRKSYPLSDDDEDGMITESYSYGMDYDELTALHESKKLNNFSSNDISNVNDSNSTRNVSGIGTTSPVTSKINNINSIGGQVSRISEGSITANDLSSGYFRSIEDTNNINTSNNLVGGSNRNLISGGYIDTSTTTPTSIDSSSMSIGGIDTKSVDTKSTSNRLEQFGSDITNSIKSMTVDLGGKMSEVFTSLTGDIDNSITATTNSKMGMELQSSVVDNTLNIRESSEAGNTFLKSIEKTLGDMLSLQKLQASAEQVDDNSGILNTMKNFITGN